jgi:hypothetical protein
LPSGATAIFDAPSLSAVTSPTTVHVAIQTVGAPEKMIRTHANLAAIALSLLLLPFGCTRRARKRLGHLSLCIILFGGVLSSLVIAGCGSTGTFLPAPQNYTLTIVATSGSVKHTAIVNLTIQ